MNFYMKFLNSSDDDHNAELHPSKDNRTWSMAITYSHHWKQEFWSYGELPDPAFEFL